MKSYLDTEEFREEMKKVGPNSSYEYRSIFDPVSSSKLKESCKCKKKQ
jgi:hypothetical protein